MDILNRIADLRCRKGWSEYELAKRSDLPQSTISSWYKKEMLPSIPSLEKICTGLGITLCQFFCEEEQAVTLTPEQKKLLHQYSYLTDAQKEKLDLFLQGLICK